jgi:hypothetical protein
MNFPQGAADLGELHERLKSDFDSPRWKSGLFTNLCEQAALMSRDYSQVIRAAGDVRKRRRIYGAFP